VLLRHLAWVVVLFAVAGCKGPPARLVAGPADTVIVNNVLPVQMPMHLVDAAGHVLPDTGVRGVVTYAQDLSFAPVDSAGRRVPLVTAGDVTAWS